MTKQQQLTAIGSRMATFRAAETASKYIQQTIDALHSAGPLQQATRAGWDSKPLLEAFEKLTLDWLEGAARTIVDDTAITINAIDTQ